MLGDAAPAASHRAPASLCPAVLEGAAGQLGQPRGRPPLSRGGDPELRCSPAAGAERAAGSSSLAHWRRPFCLVVPGCRRGVSSKEGQDVLSHNSTRQQGHPRQEGVLARGAAAAAAATHGATKRQHLSSATALSHHFPCASAQPPSSPAHWELSKRYLSRDTAVHITRHMLLVPTELCRADSAPWTVSPLEQYDENVAR